MVTEKIRPITREGFFIRLYEKAFPGVSRLVRKYGGSFDDAKDIFQDALVIYFEKQINQNFTPQINEQAYITGIAKHLCCKKYREDKSKETLEPYLNYDLTPVEEFVISNKLVHFIEQSGKKCLELLTAFYYDKLNMKEVAEKFGFSGERSATTQKYKCLEKVRNAIHTKSLTKEDFYE